MNRDTSELVVPIAALPMKLAVAREALVDGQQTSVPGTPPWQAVQALIEEIDQLMPRLPTLLNLNADSGFRLKGRTTGRREGVLRGWRTEAAHMKQKTIEELVAEVRRKSRIGKYDAQALREDFFKDGLASRADADLLIELDREVDSVHFSWPTFFISALTEFAVWNSGQPGYIDEEKSKWLLGALAHEGATDRALRALAAIAKEADCFDEAFFRTARSTRDRQEHSSQEFGIAA
jgi:hypothetical protein